jgi:hypothetical protein
MHRKVAAALVAAFALGIASCGGSEPELTRAQLVRRVEVACRAGQKVASRPHRTTSGTDAATAFLDSIVAGQEVAVERLGDLNAPDAVGDDFDTFKQGMQDRLDLIKRVAAADRAQVEAAMRDIQPQVEAVTRRIATAARGVGIRGCV